MPHLVDVLDLVTQGNGFLQFWGAPRAGQGSFVIRVCALVRSLQEELVHFVFHTCGAERKGEFACMTVRENGMVQLTRVEHLALHETKLGIDVLMTRLRDELGVTFGVNARLVNPGVQGGVIDVMDLLVWCHVMIQFDGIGVSPAKGVTRVEGSTNCKESTDA